MSFDTFFLRKSVLLFSAFLLSLYSFAQTPGLIYERATGAGTAVLDPNGDGYTSATTNGFTTNDQTQSELPFIPMIFPASEPNSDLGPGPDCGFTDFVQQAVGVEDAGQSYLDGSGNWLFRMRLGKSSPNSKSYSILIDTDHKFGSSGPNADPDYMTGNPGFEVEILLATNFGVYVYDVNGATTATLKRSYLGHSNYQKSIALSSICGDPDYFYDFFVPFAHLTSDFGITSATPLRMALIDNMAARTTTIGHWSSASDLAGVDDAAYAYNYEAAFQAVIDNYTPICASCSAGLDRSTCPSITGPIASGATSVSGTSAYGIGTLIKVYKNGVSIGTTTTGSSGAWTLSGIAPALTSGDVIGASATVAGKSESEYNCSLTTVAQTCTTALPNVNDCNSGKAISGTGAMPGAMIQVYYLNSSTPSAPSAGNQFVGGNITADATGAWIWKCVGTGQTTSCTAGGGPCLSDGQYRITQTVSGQCESLPVYLCEGTAGTSTAPVITGPVLYTANSVSGTCVSVASPGNQIVLFADGIQIGTTTVTNTTNWTISSLTLRFGQILTAKTMEGAKCISAASATVTVSAISATPVITGTYCTSTTISTVSGTSTEASGTIIQVYDNGVAAGTTTTVNANGVWSKTGLSIAPGHTITAKATITGGQQSAASASVVVGNKSTNAVAITSASLTEGDASVTGTGVNGDVITLYIDGIQIGSTTTVSSGSWTVGSLGLYDLYASGIVYATAASAGKCEGSASNTLTVQCALPSAALSVDPSSISTCAGSIEPNIQVLSAQDGVVYQLYNGVATSGTSRLGAGGTLNIATGVLSANTTITVKAVKISPAVCSAFLTDNVPVTIYAPDSTWRGAVSSDWFEPLNWCLGGGIPTSTTDIKILSGGYMPVIAAAGAVCKSITIYPGATLTTAASNNLDVYGNWTNNGSFIPNSGTITFRGNTSQTVGGAVAANTFQNVTLQNTGAAGNDGLLLQKPLTINGLLTLTDGILNSAFGLLNISATGSATSGNSSGPSFVDGPMTKTGSTAFVFPLGANRRWARLAIGAPATATTFQAQYFAAPAADVSTLAATPLPALHHVSSLEYWQLDRSAGTANVPVTLYWENASSSVINDCATLRIAHWNGTAWENNNDACTSTSSGCPTPSNQNGWIKTDGDVSAFGRFTFGSTLASNPLPVKWTRFDGACANGMVTLHWATAAEINNDYFTVEAGKSPGHLEPVGKIQGAGTYTGSNSYSFPVPIHETAPVLYYRLASTSFDGKVEYSTIISVKNCREAHVQPAIFPNPSDGKIRLNCQGYASLHLEIWHPTGELVFESDVTDNEQVDISYMPSGVYLYVLKNEGKIMGEGKLMLK